jgi:PilZ domain
MVVEQMRGLSDVTDVAMVGWPIEARERMEQSIQSTSLGREQRKSVRRRYHIEGRLLISGQDASTVQFYTRDVNLLHVGFITQTPLAVGTKAMVRLRKPTGRGITVEGRVKRCREFEPGWFDCSVEFAQRQGAFAD